MKLNFKDRLELKELLKEGYSLEYLAKETEDITSYQIRKEVAAGLLEEEFKKKLYGKYDPCRAIYTTIKKYVDEESISEFVSWYKKQKGAENEQDK